mgnify:CR=1 FL=1
MKNIRRYVKNAKHFLEDIGHRTVKVDFSPLCFEKSLIKFLITRFAKAKHCVTMRMYLDLCKSNLDMFFYFFLEI